MRTLNRKRNFWGRNAIDINAPVFLTRGGSGGRRSLVFRGSIMTDGVGLSVLKSDRDTTANNPRQTSTRDEGEFEYITTAQQNGPAGNNAAVIVVPQFIGG